MKKGIIPITLVLVLLFSTLISSVIAKPEEGSYFNPESPNIQETIHATTSDSLTVNRIVKSEADEVSNEPYVSDSAPTQKTFSVNGGYISVTECEISVNVLNHGKYFSCNLYRNSEASNFDYSLLQHVTKDKVEEQIRAQCDKLFAEYADAEYTVGTPILRLTDGRPRFAVTVNGTYLDEETTETFGRETRIGLREEFEIPLG